MPGCTACAATAPPPAGPVPWWVPAPHRDAEFTRMLFAILDGSMMSRGDGWFGPAQSRYTWAWLAARHGLPPTAELPADKFRGSPELFAALDRDRDGVIRAGDFDWSDDAPFVRESAAARRWLDRADKNNDGKLSKDEWDALFKRAAAGKDHLTPDDVRAMLFPAAPPRPAAPPPPPESRWAPPGQPPVPPTAWMGAAREGEGTQPGQPVEPGEPASPPAAGTGFVPPQ